jgi:hypothetical protein
VAGIGILGPVVGNIGPAVGTHNQPVVWRPHKLAVAAGSIPQVLGARRIVVAHRLAAAHNMCMPEVVSEHTCTTFLIWECAMGEGE